MLTAISHTIFLVIIFVLPEVMMYVAMPDRMSVGFAPRFYLKSLLYIGVFYLNYLVLIDRLLVRGHRRGILTFFVVNLLVLAAGVALGWLLMHWFQDAPPRRPRTAWKTGSFILRDCGMFILTIGLAVALRLTAKWDDLRRQRQELIANQRATELESLKQQINPHFLFNTLNTIYALIAIDGTAAQDAVHRLSAMMRYMLYDNVAMVPLSKEADFIRNYVSLMSLRMSDCRVRLTIDITGHEDAMVAPLVFITPVENAFKHVAMSHAAEEELTIRLAVDDTAVVLTTSNPYAPVSTSNSGHGLKILRRRLTLIYGQRASFSARAEGNNFLTRLSIPLAAK
ncbi:MAG: sensor histidine kinase [Muribaculaceae bacterium]|nr:sensor histidine kinase [Muribaculaceae bacterium]